MNKTVQEPFNAKKRILQARQVDIAIEAIKERHKAELKPYEEARDRLRGAIREWLEASNLQNIKTEEGTAYMIFKTNYRVEDQAMFRGYVIDNEAWGLVYWSKTISAGVKKYQEDNNNAAPPGVKLDQEITIGIRAPAKPKTEGDKTTLEKTPDNPEVETL